MFIDSLLKADIFFFVTTVCVFIVTIFLIVFLIKLTKIMNLVKNILESVKSEAIHLSSDAKELLSRIESSFIFNLFFPPKTKKSVSRKKKK